MSDKSSQPANPPQQDHSSSGDTVEIAKVQRHALCIIVFAVFLLAAFHYGSNWHLSGVAVSACGSGKVESFDGLDGSFRCSSPSASTGTK